MVDNLIKINDGTKEKINPKFVNADVLQELYDRFSIKIIENQMMIHEAEVDLKVKKLTPEKKEELERIIRISNWGIEGLRKKASYFQDVYSEIFGIEVEQDVVISELNAIIEKYERCYIDSVSLLYGIQDTIAMNDESVDEEKKNADKLREQFKNLERNKQLYERYLDYLYNVKETLVG